MYFPCNEFTQQFSKVLVRLMTVRLDGSVPISYTFRQCSANYLLSSGSDSCVSVLKNKVRTCLHCLETVVINIFFPSTKKEKEKCFNRLFFSSLVTIVCIYSLVLFVPLKKG